MKYESIGHLHHRRVFLFGRQQLARVAESLMSPGDALCNDDDDDDDSIRSGG